VHPTAEPQMSNDTQMNKDTTPDPKSASASLLGRLHEAYSSLPESERRVADTILNTPSEMPVWTASELASHAQVSNATVSRLIQRLGYRSFEEARQHARTLRETGSPLFMQDATTATRGKQAHIDLLQTEVGIIEETLSQIDDSVLNAAARGLAEARKIRLLGYRNSRFLSDYLTAQLAQLRHNVAPMALDGQTLAEGIAELGPQDVAVVVGLRRRPEQFNDIVRLLSDRGVKTLLIADKDLREAPAFAAWTFMCAVETPLPLDSYVGALTLFRMLITETASEIGDASVLYLNEVEALREALNELETVPVKHVI